MGQCQQNNEFLILVGGWYSLDTQNNALLSGQIRHCQATEFDLRYSDIINVDMYEFRYYLPRLHRGGA